jgi:hypothetical protein
LKVALAYASEESFPAGKLLAQTSCFALFWLRVESCPGLRHLVLPCSELFFKVTRQSQTLHVLLDAALNENVA